ncbi:MAG: hypothetical protein WA419_21690 [Silvibacterium sp.]
MKRWMFIVAWFAAQFLYNLQTKTSSAEGHLFITRCIIAAEYFLAPIQIIAAALAVIAILKYPWRKKPQPEPPAYNDTQKEKATVPAVA